MIRNSLAFLFLGALLSAPAGAAEAPARRLVASWETAAAPEALVADPTLTGATLADLLQHADWRVRVQAGLVQGWRDHAELFRWADALEPRTTRPGFLRFQDGEVENPALAPLFVDRLHRGGEPVAVRMALAEVLPRTGGDWADAAVGLLGSEPDPGVRAVLVADLREAPATAAVAGLRAGLRDADAGVRAEAARTAGWHPAGRDLAADLQGVLVDEVPEVRSMATRALGWLQAEGAFTALAGRLGDADPEVRLHAVRALERLDPARARALPALAALVADPDPKVARAARAVRGE